MSRPATGGGLCTAPGVRLKRGAGPGCTIPSTSTKVPRARLWGWVWASHGDSTGAPQASVPEKASVHSSRVRVRKTAANRSFMAGHCSLSF